MSPIRPLYKAIILLAHLALGEEKEWEKRSEPLLKGEAALVV